MHSLKGTVHVCTPHVKDVHIQRVLCMGAHPMFMFPSVLYNSTLKAFTTVALSEILVKGLN